MYEIKKLDVNSHAGLVLEAYIRFLPESLQCCLLGQDPDGMAKTLMIAMGATYQGKPVGLIVASYPQTPYRNVIIRYLFVDPQHRNQHLGRQLLNSLEQEARQLGGNVFTFVYQLEDPSTPALKKIFKACNWDDNLPYLIRCYYHVPTFHIPWALENAHHYPSGYEEFHWTKLTDQERRDILSQQHNNYFDSAISPFKDETILEPMNSLGLHYQGRVVGWMITHRLTPDLIRYSTLYVDPSLKHHGLIMGTLLTSSIRKHLKHPTEWAVLEIPLLRVPNTWKHFIEKRIMPHADKIEHLYQAWKG